MNSNPKMSKLQTLTQQPVKRKATATIQSPKMSDIFKKIKSEKATSNNQAIASNHNSLKIKQSLNSYNIKTSTPIDSPDKKTDPQSRQSLLPPPPLPCQSTTKPHNNDSNQPNLKLLTCRICKNSYDSKHLPVLINDCMETCCEYCAHKFLANNLNKFKCGLCGKDHRVPDSRMFQLNKFAIDLLNIKTTKLTQIDQNNNQIITNLNKSKYKEIETKLDKLTSEYEDFIEDIEDKSNKSKLRLLEYYDNLRDNLKAKYELYLDDLNNDLVEMKNKFQEQKRKLLNELNTLKQNTSTSKKDIDQKEIANKLNSLEFYLQDQIELVKQTINFKSEQDYFVNYLIDSLRLKQPCFIELQFENDKQVDKSTIYALTSNKVFYCTLDKKNDKLIANVREFKLNNNIWEKYELESCSKLKYITNDQNSLYVYFDQINECKIVKYDTKFNNKPKCLSSNREIVYMSSKELMLYSNKSNTKLVKVLDQELNSLESFGQNINEKLTFYIKSKFFKILAASSSRLIFKFENEKCLRVYSRPHGILISEIKLNDSSFEENDLNNIRIKFLNENEFHLVMVSKSKMKCKVVNDSALCLREFQFSVRPNFDRFSITNDDLLAFYYENDNLIQFIQI